MIVNKHWGYEEIIYNKEYTAKVLTVKPYKSLSLQYHNNKIETMFVSSGLGVIYLDEEENVNVMKQGSIFHIHNKRIHRVENIGDEDLIIFESSTPEIDDIVRLKIYE